MGTFNSPTAEAAQQQLERILASPTFANSVRSRRFLSYVVMHSLGESEEPLKEYSIAVEAFDRDASYDPSIDATVRVEAGRLRARLRDYYADAGRNDPIRIEIPRGSYRAVFTLQGSTQPEPVIPDVDPPVAAADKDETSDKRSKNTGAKRPLVWLLPAIALVLVCLAIAAWYLNHPSPPLRIAEYTPLTHDGNFKYLLGTDATRIYVILGGNRLAQVSLSGGDLDSIPVDFNPPPSYWDVSPDGSSLLLGSQDGGLWNFNPTGRFSRHLGHVEPFNATWSPDGKRIAYSNTQSQIFVMKSDGTDVHLLYTPTSVTWDSLGDTDLLDWSPDGQRIRFTHVHDLWEIAVDGSNPHRILPNWHASSWKCCGRWTRNGNFYVFLAGETLMRSWGLGSQMWAIDERHGAFRPRDPEPFPLTAGPIRWGNPIPSRDGTKIFAQSVTLRGQLVRYDPQSKDMKPYLNGISAEFLTYSPDGKSVAYVTFPQGILWRSNLDGSSLVQLTQPPFYPKRALWSPDGSRIIFLDSNPTGKHSIYMVSAQGGAVERVFPEDDGEENEQSWSPDGRKILFLRCACKTNAWDGGLRIEDISTHQFTTIPDSNRLWSVRWSPDGRYVEARRDGNSMVIYKFSDQKWTKIQDGASDWQSWSRDGRFIYYFSWPDSVIYRVPVSGGKPEKVAALPDFPQTGWAGGWMGLDPNDTPVLLRDTGTSDIYALTVEQR
jgi:Tol biopolymer transport system component